MTLLCLCIIQAQNFFQENAMRNWVLKYRILHFFLQIYYLFRLSIKKCSLSSPSLSLLFSSWSSFFAWTRFWKRVKIVIHYALLFLMLCETNYQYIQNYFNDCLKTTLNQKVIGPWVFWTIKYQKWPISLLKEERYSYSTPPLSPLPTHHLLHGR